MYRTTVAVAPSTRSRRNSSAKTYWCSVVTCLLELKPSERRHKYCEDCGFVGTLFLDLCREASVGYDARNRNKLGEQGENLVALAIFIPLLSPFSDKTLFILGSTGPYLLGKEGWARTPVEPTLLLFRNWMKPFFCKLRVLFTKEKLIGRL